MSPRHEALKLLNTLQPGWRLYQKSPDDEYVRLLHPETRTTLWVPQAGRQQYVAKTRVTLGDQTITLEAAAGTADLAFSRLQEKICAALGDISQLEAACRASLAALRPREVARAV